MRTTIICEMSTNHGGDLELACDMVRAAAESGADYAKFQTYDIEKRLNPKDPQAAWLRQAHLDRSAHEQLMQTAEEAGICFLSTPFDADSLQMLRELGLRTFKIASSESGNKWWLKGADEHWIVSYPWGRTVDAVPTNEWHYLTRLTAIPLYPTPLECVGRATLLDGYSDHAEGLDACYWALAQGVKVLEVHMTIGKGRVCVWDKSPDQIRELRRFADSMETIRSGVKQQFRERWSR